MTDPRHLTAEELLAGLGHIRRAPKDEGVLELIVRRPAIGVREALQEARLTHADGLVGDTWRHRGSNRTPNGSPHPDKQLNVMNSRAAALVAGDTSRWALAGDQLFIDLDLSGANLPPGSQLALGTAIIEITPEPHTGCQKFVSRFGLDAMKFVNSPVGRELNLRGVNARVVQAGVIRVGDTVQVIAPLT
jgi:MOSC domain-containing protein YiiM